MQDHSYGIIAIKQDKNQQKILLIRHRQDVRGSGGHWSFPKGHKHNGENDITAALREFREETGIGEVVLISDEPFLEHYHYSSKGQVIDKTVAFYLARVGSYELSPQAEEIQDAAWLTVDNAYNRLTYPETKAVLRQVERYLTTVGQ